tara:strand:+ start:515 stop:1015 length:501 start_codon:yes stop_codon:yes gene_type:complete
MNDKISIGQYSKVADDVKFGKGVLVYSHVNLYGCEIQDFTKIGTFVEIQKGSFIGRNCKISSHSFICEGVHIDDGVFIGHNVTFINDKFPSAINEDGSMQGEEDWDVVSTHIGKGVSIGSSSTIMCGIRIGESSIVGAGSVVTHNIPSNEVWAGNPARFLKSKENI